MKPILKWPGGKRHLAKRLIDLFPEHKCYCEVFAGGLALLLAKPPSKVEIINDLNQNLVTLYRVALFHSQALLYELTWHLSARDNIKDYMAQPGLTDLQRAARFLVRNHTSFAGSGTSFGVAKTKPVKLDLDFLQERLRDLRSRLNGVTIENLPYERCLANYDSPDTLFFLDPPYLNANPKAYVGWNEAQMTTFARHVQALAGRWIVTVDDSELNRHLFKDYQVEAVKTRNRCTNQRTHGDRTFGELIITNAVEVQPRCNATAKPKNLAKRKSSQAISGLITLKGS